MKTCFIHAGTHKTGTTFIQARLLALRSALAKQGLHIPAIGAPSTNIAAQHNLAFDLNEDPHFCPDHGTLEDLAASLRSTQPSRILLSSEEFLSLARKPRGMARLRKTLEDQGYRITWIFYLRNYHEWLESAYTQHIKSGTTYLPFERWVAKRERLVMHDSATSFATFFESDDSVVLRSYALAKTDIFRDFLDTVGLGSYQPPADQTRQNLRNSRPNALQVEFFRRLASRKEQAQMKERDLMAYAHKVAHQLPESPDFLGMSEEAARFYYEETRPSYQTLLQRAGVNTPFEEFFPPPSPRKEQTFATLEFPRETRLALRKLVEKCLNQV